MPPSRLKPSEAEWLRVKAVIRRMYLVDEMPLKDLVVEVRNLGLSIT